MFKNSVHVYFPIEKNIVLQRVHKINLLKFLLGISCIIKIHGYMQSGWKYVKTLSYNLIIDILVT